MTDCSEVAKKVLAAAKVGQGGIELSQLVFPQITMFANYYSGDPYLGGESSKKKDDKIRELEAEVKRLKGQLGLR